MSMAQMAKKLTSEEEPSVATKRTNEEVAGSTEANEASDAAAKRQRVEGDKDEEGNLYFPISAKRRITLKPFKGRMLVDIRETYDKPDGTTGYGRKGISLTVDQFRQLSAAMPTILDIIDKEEQ